MLVACFELMGFGQYPWEVNRGSTSKLWEFEVFVPGLVPWGFPFFWGYPNSWMIYQWKILF